MRSRQSLEGSVHHSLAPDGPQSVRFPSLLEQERIPRLPLHSEISVSSRGVVDFDSVANQFFCSQTATAQQIRNHRFLRQQRMAFASPGARRSRPDLRQVFNHIYRHPMSKGCSNTRRYDGAGKRRRNLWARQSGNELQSTLRGMPYSRSVEKTCRPRPRRHSTSGPAETGLRFPLKPAPAARERCS